MAGEDNEANGFFSLSRELRDNIYDIVREDHQEKIGQVSFKYRAAIPKVRLISRQFKSEYDQRSAVNTFVHVMDPDNVCTFRHFPRLAIRSHYLELAWANETYCSMPFTLSRPFAPIMPSLGDRLRSLERLVGHLPEIKSVDVQHVVVTYKHLKNVVGELIACPILTSFSIRGAGFFSLSSLRGTHGLGVGPKWMPCSRAGEKVDYAIWSRGGGFQLDNTDEENAVLELKGARERHEEIQRLRSRRSRVRRV